MESIAVAEAKRTGKPVDVPSMRTESVDVVAQPDGRLKSTVYAQPQRVRRAGGWVDIDPALRKRTDGTVAPKAAVADVTFSGGGNSAPLVRMTSAGKSLSLSWPQPLPEPVIDGATAEYRTILPDVDLKLTATRTGFTQVFVVHTAEAAKNPALNALRLGMKGDGLRIEEAADGSLSAVDTGAGGTIFKAPVPVMWDSTTTGAPATGASAPAAPVAASASGAPSPSADGAKAAGRSAATAVPAVSATTVPAAGTRVAKIAVDFPAAQDQLVLTPDQGMLDDPATVFPVMIDPSWDTPHASDWAGVSKYYPTQAYNHFTYNSNVVHDWGVGYCGDTTRCQPTDVKRAFFQFPTGQFVGKQILKATFGAYESWSYSCQKTSVELWNTGHFTNKLTWNSQNNSTFWSRYLQTIDDAKGWTGPGSSCSAGGWLEFGGEYSDAVRTLVQDGANWGWQSSSFGLRASNESDLNGWKKFTDGAYLQVYYNLPPRQPANADLSMQPGSVCSGTAVQVQTVPQLTAVLKDPDGEAVGAQFALGWDDGTGWKRRWFSTGTEATVPASNTFKASGSLFNQTPPANTPTDRSFTWEVRAWDGAAWGPWNSDGNPTACYVRVDSSIPAGPGVTSSTYPISTSAGSVPPVDGVGRYGTFTIDSVETNVVKYQWGLDTAASAAHEVATTAGAAQTISVLMDKPGPHLLSVRAISGAGVSSQLETYYFNVLSGQGARDIWSLDDSGGGTTLAGSSNSATATLGSTVTAGAAGHAGQALAFNGAASTGYAQTDSAVLDTSMSYTVSAWVRPDAATTTRVAVSQNGADSFSFTLGIGMVGTDPRWSFKVQSDGAGQDSTSTYVVSAATAASGQWTHLAGVYDKASNTIRLYVNGTSAGSAVVPSSVWDGHATLQIGRDRWNKLWAAPWSGSIDEVKMWDRALSPADITKVATDQPLTTGVPAKSVWHLDEAAGATSVSGAPETDTLTLNGGAQAGTAVGVSGSAVTFDGTDDTALTARTAVDATRSFSVAAWVRLPAITNGSTAARVVLNQTGVHNSELSLYYSAYAKKWVFGRYKEDSTGATLISANQVACTAPVGATPCFGATDGQWTHLVGVSDAVAQKIRLYVNGYLAGEADYTQTTPWPTPGPLQLGAASREGASEQFFGGDIDDVRVWDRVITTPEVGDLVNSVPQLLGHWKLATSSGDPLASPNEISGGAAVVLGGSAKVNPTGGVIGAGSLSLNGTTGFAENTPTLLHTDRSFSLSVWAATAGAPGRDMTALSVPGANGGSVTLRWHYLGDDPGSGAHLGEWQASVRSTDTAGAAQTTITHVPDSEWGLWSHLGLVYDGLAGSLALYVNGDLDRPGCETSDLSCAGRSLSLSSYRPFEAAGGGLQFGRTESAAAWGEYFSGELADVRVYQGVLTGEQVSALSTSF
ncbi:LamG-like jellyroll fold domain-containing protein [Kitasatospora sp. NBC_01539]|uniref:LamG-like jellyroll fold domain-containing protein n=1 Tax=Kitasatospora sp. NBC_01539 TaxID=2903577 RepID=UPI003860288A